MSDPVISEACEFVTSMTGVSCTPSNCAEVLKSGVVLGQLANKLKPGAVKVVTSTMPFKQMEGITAFVAFARAFGVEERNLFVTVDLFEAKNIKAVATCVRELKRLSGAGFDKATAGNAAAPAASAAAVSLGKDDSATGEVSLNEQPVEIRTADAVQRTGAALLAGHGKLDASAGVATICVVCNRSITGAVINAVGKTWHTACFTCKKCDKKLSEAKYFEHASKPYCDRCILIVNPQTNVKAKSKDADLFAK